MKQKLNFDGTENGTAKLKNGYEKENAKNIFGDTDTKTDTLYSFFSKPWLVLPEQPGQLRPHPETGFPVGAQRRIGHIVGHSQRGLAGCHNPGTGRYPAERGQCQQ